MAATWLLADAAAQSTAPNPITNSQTTLVLASSATFPVPGAGQQYYVRIDTTPISTVYEYALVTANNTGTNTLTLTRGQAGTSAQAFSAGATVTYALLAETLMGAFARIDQTSQQALLGPLAIPPAVGSAVAPTNYGSVPVKLAEQLLGASASTVTFSSIPQGFRHLQLMVVARGDTAGSGGDIYRTDLLMQFNGDTANNYGWEYQDDVTTTVSANQFNPSANIGIGHAATASATSTTPGSTRIDIPWYSGTNWIKQAIGQSVRLDTGGSGHLRWGSWNNTAAITSITLKLGIGLFVANSLFTLEGHP